MHYSLTSFSTPLQLRQYRLLGTIMSQTTMSQTTLMPTVALSPQVNFRRCVHLGNVLMLISFIVCAISILATFKYDNLISIQVQIIAHICTIIFAGLFKLGYVIRCVGQHGLGKQNF